MPDYINPVPPPNDPDQIAEATFDEIRATFPNYEPQEGQLATIVITALALRAAEIADLVPLIPKAVFRWYGAKVVGLPPEDGGPANASVTITVRDTAGYTIPADTALTIQDADGDLHIFVLDDDAVVPPGLDAISNVIVTAQDDGTQANDITTGTTTLVDALDYVINVAHQGTTAGGLDAETDDAYLNRLSRRLGLIPRPVHADDFAAITTVTFPEVYRAMALDLYAPGVNEKQTIAHTATAGTFTVVIEGGTSAAINFNDSAATVKTKLEAVGTVGAGKLNVTGGPLGTAVTVEFVGTLGESNRTQMAVGTNSLTGGGGAASLAFSTIQQGAAPDPVKIANISIAGILASGAAWGSTLKAEIDAFLQDQREFGFVVNAIDPTFNIVDVSFSFTSHSGFDSADVKARAEAEVAAFLNPITFGAPPGDTLTWTNKTNISLFDIAGVLDRVTGLDRVTAITIGFNGGAQTSTEAHAMTGTIPLPTPGTIVGTPV